MKYGGSWAKGFASTFDPIGGINLGLQWKEKKAAQKKIDDAVEQLKLNSSEFAAMYDKARADGSITQQEYGDAMAWAIPLGKEFTGKVNDLYTNYQVMTPDQLKTELGNIDAIYEFSKELDFTNLEQMKEFGSKLTQTDAKMQWDLIIKSIEGREKPVAETKEPTISDYGTGLKYLTNIAKIPPENWETARKGLESKFGFDYSGITQESLKETEMGDEVFNLYNTPEEVMTNVKAPAGLTVMPKRDTKTGKYYASFSKETGVGVTTPAPTSTENTREDILNADTFEDAQRIYKNYATKYDEKSLMIDLPKDWTDTQTGYLMNLRTCINKLIDEKGWLKKGTITEKEVGVDFKGDQPVEEIYKMLREEYKKYRDMLEKLGVDLTEFPELKPLEEIEKVGLGEGFWGWGKQKGQYKGIYK